MAKRKRRNGSNRTAPNKDNLSVTNVHTNGRAVKPARMSEEAHERYYADSRCQNPLFAVLLFDTSKGPKTDLTASEKMVLIYIADYWNATHEYAWPSLRLLA